MQCCGSSVWIDKMSDIFPVPNTETLFKYAQGVWFACDEKDWLEAFSHHPKIGDMESLQKKFDATAQWASGEQSLVNAASNEVLEALAQGNKLYEEKFGYIFIVSATAKSATEMLIILQSRLDNDPKDEINIAMREQNKITRIRLEKLLS
jgi:2-oxo-4-hydroxy-4-carboxy-5-ureidoimidazoline decarboxylase